jgi:hypothetical protein
VETGDDSQRSVGFDDEQQSVRETAEQGAADALVDDRKLLGLALIRWTTVPTAARKWPAQTGNLFLVPVLSVDQLGAGRQGEGNGVGYGH